MSLSIRNLVIFSLFCVLISTVSISRTLRNHNKGENKHQTSSKHYQQAPKTSNTFFADAQNIANSISTSIQPNVPSIIKTQNLPTYTFTRNTCDTLNTQQNSQTLDQIRQTKENIKKFQNNVKDPQILSDANNSYSYLNTLERLASYKCSDLTREITIGPSPYQSNLNTKRAWIYGGLKQADLVKDYTDRIAKYNNVTNCGQQTPFFNGFSCVACSQPTPVWNMNTSTCDACRHGAIYDSQTHTCVICPDGTYFHPETRNCAPAEPLDPSLKDLWNAIF